MSEPQPKPEKPDVMAGLRRSRFLNWLNRYGVSRRKFKKHRWTSRLGQRVFDRHLWVFDRDPLARGWLIGSIAAASPLMGLQTILALPCNILFRANIPITLFLILLTNPVTALPFYGFCYWVGCRMSGQKMLSFSLDSKFIEHVFPTLMLGCTTVGLVVGLTGYFVFKLVHPVKPVRRAPHHKSPVRPVEQHHHQKHSSGSQHEH